MEDHASDEPIQLKKDILRALLWLLLTTFAVIVAVRYLDRPVSLFIQEHLYDNRIWGKLTGQLPDVLLITVGLVSIPSYLIYLARKRSHLYDRMTFLLHHVACSLPVSFIAKSILKTLFGRVQTRYWLQNPNQYGFHWLHAGDNFIGFPSGHMAVFATLFAAIWRIFPQFKPVLVMLLVVLAILLMATNYHFLGDVVAGTYLGLLVEWAMVRLLQKAEPA